MATVVAVVTSHKITQSPPMATLPNAPAPGSLPTGREVSLGQAGPLAVGPSGALYVVDEAHDRVVVRQPNGTFRVVASIGTEGFSGDGGLATQAQLSHVADMAVAPDGELYLADGERIRAIDQSGVIRTIAGNGSPADSVSDNTPALAASLGLVISIAFSPSGQLYLTTGSQILRLSSSDTLHQVPALIPAGLLQGPLTGLGSLAVDGQGNVYVSSTTGGWTVWKVSPAGQAVLLGFDRGSGGKTAILQRAADGAIYADDNQVVGALLQRVQLIPPSIKDFVWMNYFAIAPIGTFFADDLGPPAFEPYQQIVEVGNGRAVSLWRGKARSGGAGT